MPPAQPISRAMVCSPSYYDPSVIRKSMILLSPDRQFAWTKITMFRVNILPYGKISLSRSKRHGVGIFGGEQWRRNWGQSQCESRRIHYVRLKSSQTKGVSGIGRSEPDKAGLYWVNVLVTRLSFYQNEASLNLEKYADRILLLDLCWWTTSI